MLYAYVCVVCERDERQTDRQRQREKDKRERDERERGVLERDFSLAETNNLP